MLFPLNCIKIQWSKYSGQYAEGYYYLRCLDFAILKTAYFASTLILQFCKDLAEEKLLQQLKTAKLLTAATIVCNLLNSRKNLIQLPRIKEALRYLCTVFLCFLNSGLFSWHPTLMAVSVSTVYC